MATVTENIKQTLNTHTHAKTNTAFLTKLGMVGEIPISLHVVKNAVFVCACVCVCSALTHILRFRLYLCLVYVLRNFGHANMRERLLFVILYGRRRKLFTFQTVGKPFIGI